MALNYVTTETLARQRLEARAEELFIARKRLTSLQQKALSLRSQADYAQTREEELDVEIDNAFATVGRFEDQIIPSLRESISSEIDSLSVLSELHTEHLTAQEDCRRNARSNNPLIDCAKAKSIEDRSKANVFGAKAGHLCHLGLMNSQLGLFNKGLPQMLEAALLAQEARDLERSSAQAADDASRTEDESRSLIASAIARAVYLRELAPQIATQQSLVSNLEAILTQRLTLLDNAKSQIDLLCSDEKYFCELSSDLQSECDSVEHEIAKLQQHIAQLELP